VWRNREIVIWQWVSERLRVVCAPSRSWSEFSIADTSRVRRRPESPPPRGNSAIDATLSVTAAAIAMVAHATTLLVDLPPVPLRELPHLVQCVSSDWCGCQQEGQNPPAVAGFARSSVPTRRSFRQRKHKQHDEKALNRMLQSRV
jgi:hypothetical protein